MAIPFKDSLDNVKDLFVEKWAEFQETTLYINSKEKYHNLSRPAQKSVQLGIVAFFVGSLLIYIGGVFSEANDHLENFSKQRAALQSLIQLRKDQAQVPQLPAALPPVALRSRVSAILARVSLDPTQTESVRQAELTPDPNSQLVPETVVQNAVLVSLKKLNLKQIVDIGYRLQSMHVAVKVSAVDIQANIEDNHYFDVTYSVVSYTPSSTAEDDSPPTSVQERRSDRRRSRG